MLKQSLNEKENFPRRDWNLHSLTSINTQRTHTVTTKVNTKLSFTTHCLSNFESGLHYVSGGPLVFEIRRPPGGPLVTSLILLPRPNKTYNGVQVGKLFVTNCSNFLK